MVTANSTLKCDLHTKSLKIGLRHETDSYSAVLIHMSGTDFLQRKNKMNANSGKTVDLNLFKGFQSKEKNFFMRIMQQIICKKSPCYDLWGSGKLVQIKEGLVNRDVLLVTLSRKKH